MTAKKVLTETLKDLSSEELEEFKSLIEYEKDFQSLSRSRLKAANKSDIVELLVETNSPECVELTKRVLKKMRRTDLEQSLSDISPGTKEKQHPLIQRVEAMASVIELLLETLKDLTDWELKEFKIFLLGPILFDRHFSLRLLQMADRQAVVFSIVVTYGQQSVEMTRNVLRKMNRIDLVQKLSDSSSGHRKRHSLDEHLSTLIHKVATMAAVKELLWETLIDLSYEEIPKFKWLLQFTFFQRSPSDISQRQLQALRGTDQLVDLMVDVCGQQSVEVMKEVCMNTNRTDLVQRLPEISSGQEAAGSSAGALGVNITEREKHSVDEHWPALIQEVNTMVSIIELLLETLAALSDEELEKFRQYLLHQNDFVNSLMLREIQDTVFFMVQTGGKQSLERTKEVLEKIKRTDLVQRLSDRSSAPREKRSDEHRPALIHRVATMAAVKHLLLKTLNDLSDEEHKKFKWILEETVSQKNVGFNQSQMRPTVERAELVDLMVQTYGQQCFDLTREVVEKMNRIDLLQRLSEPSSGLKEKHSADEHRPAVLKRAAVKPVLLETLKDFSHEELEKFKYLLQFTYFHKGLPSIPRILLDLAVSADTLVDLMVENQQPMEVTKEVFLDMNRPDLVERLSETSSGLKGPSGSLEPKACGSMMQVSSDWTKVDPEVNRTDEAPTYSLQSEAGNFECSVSGLRWVCKDKVRFKYQFRSLKDHMQRIESITSMPAGPLMDITVNAGKIYVVYLPHWICIDDPTLLDKFAVLHIDDCGVTVENVSEVTSSHVKLCEPAFSGIVPLLQWLGILAVEIYCKVLIYCKTDTKSLTLHVYLIPPDPALIEEIDQRESSEEYKRIRKPHPKLPLKMDGLFILNAQLDEKKVPAGVLRLRHDIIDTDFAEVYIENHSDRIVELKLTQEKGEQPVWSCLIRKGEYQSSGHIQEEHPVDEPRPALLQEAKAKEMLLNILRKLNNEQFNSFIWHLVILGDIPEGELDNKKKGDVVNKIWQTYTQRSVEVTKTVLGNIPRNDLVQLLDHQLEHLV